MSFNEWWKDATDRYNIPERALFVDFGKLVAEVAWRQGFAECHRIINEALETGGGDNDTEAGSETV